MSDKLYTVRDYIENDKNFIFATWLRGLYYGGVYFTEIPKDIFMREYHYFLDRIIEDPNIKIKVACLKDDPEVILGYSVLNSAETVLNWVFCKSAWRGIGLARALTPLTVASVSHLTKVGLSILRKRPNVVFNPFKVS